MNKVQSFSIPLFALLLSACNTVPSVDSLPQDVVPLSNDSAVVRPVTIDGLQDFEEIDPTSVAGRAPIERVIYFDYDQSELRSEFLDIVAQHGRFLAQNPGRGPRKNHRQNVAAAGCQRVAIQNGKLWRRAAR